MPSLTRHLLAEYYGCVPEILDDVERIREILVVAAERSRSTVFDVNLHHFEPQGISGVAIIGESHAAIHTWPEYAFATIEIFVCTEEATPWEGHDYLVEQLQPREVEVRIIERGDLERVRATRR